MADERSAKLLIRFRAGDEQAATELFERYAERLIKLARTHLSAKLARRIDPEDVVQSAYRSFFSGAQRGQFTLEREGDLWSLLAAITLNKIHRQVKHHKAEKRSISAEESRGGDSARSIAQHIDVISNEPLPEHATALVDQVEYLMDDLQPQQRLMLEMRLQGYAVKEIAEIVSRSQRAVYRLLEKLRIKLTQLADEESTF